MYEFVVSIYIGGQIPVGEIIHGLNFPIHKKILNTALSALLLFLQQHANLEPL